MMILSFAETTPALLAGAKTVTRREWSDSHARKFTAGALVQAWDKTPRVKGARRVGTIRITQSPYREQSDLAPMTDFDREGFTFMENRGLTLFGGMTPVEVWRLWHDEPRLLWVVRFELVGVVGS